MLMSREHLKPHYIAHISNFIFWLPGPNLENQVLVERRLFLFSHASIEPFPMHMILYPRRGVKNLRALLNLLARDEVELKGTWGSRCQRKVQEMS